MSQVGIAGKGGKRATTSGGQFYRKKKKNLSISSMAGARTYTLISEEDIDKFLAEMKKKLVSELDADTVITLS